MANTLHENVIQASGLASVCKQCTAKSLHCGRSDSGRAYHIACRAHNIVLGKRPLSVGFSQRLQEKSAGIIATAVSEAKTAYLVFSCVFSHGLKALVCRLQHCLLLLAAVGRLCLSGSEAMDPQLGQAAHKQVQLSSNAILQSRPCLMSND